jgi:hypothetical protein
MAQDDGRNGRSGSDEWMAFPGGELEGNAASVLCAACLDAFNRRATRNQARSPNGTSRARTLCFQCYRAQLDRDRALRAAGNLHTASEARFQSQLPFEPVDRPRLQMLKAQRSQARSLPFLDRGGLVTRRRRAQMAARRALGTIAATLEQRHRGAAVTQDRDCAMALALRAAELQFPESWLPFVVAQ